MPKENSSIVLLSAGLDSTVNLYEAIRCSSVRWALTFNYGQRAANREIFFAKKLCQELGIPHKTIELDWFGQFSQRSALCSEEELPQLDFSQLDDQGVCTHSAQRVWVPNRNGIFLNIAAGFAEGAGAQWIVPGFNAEEAQTFPDNSEDFLRALNQSLAYSTRTGVVVRCFTTHLAKAAIVRRGQELGVNFDLVWPCYEAGEKPCGQCESCLRYRRAWNRR